MRKIRKEKIYVFANKSSKWETCCYTKSEVFKRIRLGSNTIKKFVFMEGKKRADRRLFETARVGNND